MTTSKPHQSSPFVRRLVRLFRRFHLTIFFVLIVAVLAASVILINNMVNDASTATQDYTSPITAGSIDQATLERIKTLHKSDEPIPDPAPASGRTNPFGE